MGDKTGIAWTDATWNPLRGCSRVSTGCENCYAETMASRFSGEGQAYERLTSGGKWTGMIRLVPKMLLQPLRWQRPRKIFVNSMSDLFHPNVPFVYIAAVFGVMAAAERHTFQVLTKRPGRMLRFFEWLEEQEPGNPRLEVCWQALKEEVERVGDGGPMHTKYAGDPEGPWPLPNVWLGVTAENQFSADNRIPMLQQAPAAVRWVSIEPMVGLAGLREYVGGQRGCAGEHHGSGAPGCPKELHHHHDDRCAPALDWVVVGGESGPGARPMDIAWVEDIVSQCKASGTPVFVKQLGAKPFDSREGFRHSDPHPDGPSGDPDCRLRLRSREGRDPGEWPEILRVQEMPCPDGKFRDALAEAK